MTLVWIWIIRGHIGWNEFEQIKLLPVNNHFEQIIRSMSFKFCNNMSPPYINDVFKPAGQSNTTIEHLWWNEINLWKEPIVVRRIFPI